MAEAIFWGAVGASALLIGALIAYAFAPGRVIIAIVMALGSGVLIGSVSFELVEDALESQSVGAVSLAMGVGAGVFAFGDWYLDRRGGSERKDSEGAQATGNPLAIVLGSVLDGVPESFVLGLTVKQGAVSVSLLAGILLSNLPEGMASSSGLKIAGWPQKRVVRMWLLVIIVSTLAAGAGYLLLGGDSGRTGAIVQAFAGGALLAMIADTLLPESYEVEGVLTGPLVVAGFALSIGLEAL